MADSSSDKRKLLLVTDLGKDIDDTVALAMTAASDAVQLVGMVTTGGNTANRARFARQLLRVFGIRDETCTVIAGPDPAAAPNPKSRSYGHLPDVAGLPLSGVGDGDVIAGGEALQRLIQLVADHAGLAVVGIGPLTPLAAALGEDEGRLKGSIGSLHLQGCDGERGPDPGSYNFREDFGAARTVFDQLRGATPFHFLGKYAAYQVPLRSQHILQWDAARPQAVRQRTPSWLAMAATQMKAFRDSSTELYFDIYPLDVAKAKGAGKPIHYAKRERSDERQPQLLTDDWYLYLEHDVMIKPYDPLVVASLIAPELFQIVAKDSDRLIGNTKAEPGVTPRNAKRLEQLVRTLVEKASRQMTPAPDRP